MSTIEPEEMSGGRRIEGNSIWRVGYAVSYWVVGESLDLGGVYKSFVWREEDCYAGVDFADREGDEHDRGFSGGL